MGRIWAAIMIGSVKIAWASSFFEVAEIFSTRVDLMV